MATVLAVATLAVVGVTFMKNRPAARGADPAPDTLTYTPGDADALAARMFTDPHTASPMALNPRRVPLDHEPAGLPLPPHARPGERFTTTDGTLIEEVSFCRVPDGDPAALADHYRQAAAAAGFQPLGPTPTPTPTPTIPSDPRTLLFHDPQNPSRLLTVRLGIRHGDVHVTVWLRYAARPG